MKNSTKYKAWRVIIDSIEGVEVKEDTENNQIVAIKENDIVGLFDLELDAGSVKENKPGWMLKQDPVLAAKVKSNVDLAKKRQAAYGDPDWQKKQDEKKELAKESWLADDYVTWVDDSSKAKIFTQAEAEIVAKQVNGLASPRFPDGEETDSYVVSNINQYESTELQVRNTFHDRDTHPFYLKIDENGQWWIVNKRTGKQHKPSKNDKETAREEAKVMRKNDPFVESIKESKWKVFKTYEAALKALAVFDIGKDKAHKYISELNTSGKTTYEIKYKDGAPVSLTEFGQQRTSVREAALPEKDMIGGFRELSVGKNFWYGKTKYQWALEHDLPHEIVSDHGNRYAKVLNTVAYVAVDENDDGTPKLEKWYIKHFQKKED